MPYTLKGRVVARLCDDCEENLENTTIRVYAATADDVLTHRVAADARQTTRVRDDDESEALARILVGEAQVGPGGGFAVVLAEGYKGGAVDVDLYCGTLGPRKPPKPRQLFITTVQPLWRQGEAGPVAAFEHEFSDRIWCNFLALLGLWSICGRVTVCGSQPAIPVGGVTVHAFDRDWLQDDPLGADVTDASGHYRIVYTRPAFEKTIFPFLQLELQSGPDVYFRITSPSSVVMLAEPPSMGWSQGRKNVGPCACIDLCVDAAGGGEPGDIPVPSFRRIGAIDYVTEVDSGPAGSGLTIADHRAFFSSLRLNGVLPKTMLDGTALEYRFEVRELPGGSWAPVLASQIGSTLIATQQRLVGGVLEEKFVYVNGSPAPDHIVVTPDAGGWIKVPQGDHLTGPDGLVVTTGDMIRLNSEAVSTWAHHDAGAVTAGHSAAPLLADKFFGIRLRVRTVGASATEAGGGECQRVAIINHRYANVNKGGTWAPFQVSGQLAVVSVDVEELLMNGCDGVTHSLTPLFTAAHPNLGSAVVTMSGPGAPYTFTMPPLAAEDYFGQATPAFNVASLPKCAYIVDLTATLLLTTGDSSPNPITDRVAFCKTAAPSH